MNTTYKAFPNAHLIRAWDELLLLTRAEVVDLQGQWEQIHEENQALYHKLRAEKAEKIHQVTTYLKDMGIDVYKYKTRSIFKEKNGFKAWFKTNIADELSRKFPDYHRSIPSASMESKEVKGIKLYNNVSPTNLVELYDRITRQYNYEFEKRQKVDQLLVKSIEYAAKNNIDIDGFDQKGIVYEVSRIAKEKYLEENVPQGSEVYLKHECDTCNTYIMGEHRCSCGNRKICIVVEGSIIEGFYHYPEGC